MAIVDAVDDAALDHLAAACAIWPLVVAGSGLASALPRHWGFCRQRRRGALPAMQGLAAIVSGSCSAASQAQVADFVAAGGDAFAVDPLRLADGADVAAEALAWAASRLRERPDDPVLVYATAAPDCGSLGSGAARRRTRRHDRRAGAGDGRARAVRQRRRRLVVAGGETSGACVQALGVRRLRIGPQIDPGVPWCHADPGLHLALKSGNFGGVDFFRQAFDAAAD